jgi:hypothetical protein
LVDLRQVTPDFGYVSERRLLPGHTSLFAHKGVVSVDLAGKS